MSAAEKLGRLEAQPESGSGWDSGWHHSAHYALFAVLPEIIAVLKAAEAVAGPAAYRGGLTGRAALARDALSALDEKLGDVT